MSDFSSLRIALSSLAAAQKGLEVTGHNIANAKSEGYSRQQVVTTADGGPSIAAMYARWKVGGYGVKSVNVQRVNDVFLTNRTYIEHAASGAASTTRNIFRQIESVFPEPGPYGIQQQLTGFWSAWDDVANQPQDLGARAQLAAQTSVLLDKFHQSANDLYSIKDDATQRLVGVVSQVNSLIGELSSLNNTIAGSTSDGRSPNDLLDQRDALVRKISDLMDVTVRYDSNGRADVFVPGGPVLLGSQAYPLTAVVTAGGASVRFASGAGSDLVFTGGQLAGLLGAVNDVLPTFLASLDTFANSLRDTVNGALGAKTGSVDGSVPVGAQDFSSSPTIEFRVRVNGGGWATLSVTAGADFSGAGGAAAFQSALQDAIDAVPGLGLTASVSGGNGSALSISLVAADGGDVVEVSPASAGGAEQPGLAQLFSNVALDAGRSGGGPFFVGNGASGLALRAEIAGDPLRIAVGRAGAGTSDGFFALNLAELGSGAGGPDAAYRSMIASLGAASARAARIADNQDAMTAQVDAAKDAQSGVNLDEEMVAMVQFQHAYAAAARYLSVIDEMLNTLVNTVGR